MRKSILFVLIFPMAWLGWFSDMARAKASPSIANYDISVTLDASNKALDGHEVLEWRNDSPDEIRELWFHLYMNAFKNEKSTFMRESKGRLRTSKIRDDDWGWIDVKKMQIVNGPDLTKAIRFVHPDDDNADDQTVIKVDLPQPLLPGDSLRLSIEFYTKLPHVFARAGYHVDFVLAGQWFPKIGVYEKAGMRYAQKGEWNCHQYHAHSEFYADYGTYRVAITAPAHFVLGASGVQQSRMENQAAGTVTTIFYQEDIHDFAWTAYPRFKRIEREFRADQEVTPKELEAYAAWFNVPQAEMRLKDVKMILLIQPEHENQVERHFRALTQAIKHFGLWYGKYPYDTITVVDPPWGAEGAGGMEYPTFITAGTRWLVSKHNQQPEGVIVHEFGHQYWYGLVGSNEFEEAWLDEGFNTYSTGLLLDKVYGEARAPAYLWRLPLAGFFGVATGHDRINRMAYLSQPKADNLVRKAWEFNNGGSYSMNSYSRTALVLRTLENLLGKQTMDRVMRTYHQRWRYRHPSSHDFIKVVNEVSAKDVTGFFNQCVFGSNVLDYRVAEVTSEAARHMKGVFDQNGGKRTVSTKDAAKQIKEKPQDALYESEVMIRREGEIILPVDIEIVFEGGEVVRKVWDGEYRWVKYRFTRPAKIAYVQVDPEQRLLLDINFSNNSRRLEPRYGPVFLWTAKVMFWIQHGLQLVAAFG